VDRKRLALTQEEQAENMVEISVGQQDCLDRAAAEARIARMQGGKILDLCAQIRRGIDQKPRFSVC